MLVLAIDTSTPAVTAGVARVLHPAELIDAGGSPGEPVAVLAEQTADDPFGHVERLMPLVTAALQQAGARLRDLDAVVVGVGPGPFTGLRVGMATAAALGDGLGVGVFGVPSHDAVAAACGAQPAPLLVVTDARRREVYVSGYDGAGRRAGGPAVLAPAAIGDFLTTLPTPPSAMAGAGAQLSGLDLPVLSTGPVTLGLARLAGPQLVTGAVPGPLTPLYLRRPDATEPAPSKPVLR